MSAMKEFLSRVAELLGEHGTLALVTVIKAEGSTPRAHGAKMAVLPDGGTFGTIGGGVLELAAVKDALAAIRAGEGFLREYALVAKSRKGLGALCGGKATVLVEVLRLGERLIICGGGHIGLVLARMAVELGFRVVVVDPREEFSDRDRFPAGVEVLHAEPAGREVAALVDQNTYVVILTHSHVIDKEALRVLAPSKAAYVGMIGSRNKVAQVLKQLGREGVPREALERVHAPVGLDIAAETPAEIAVSILSEMVHFRRRGASSPESLKHKRRGGC
jgi:xanthine dehydrogenase accessory factor